MSSLPLPFKDFLLHFHINYLGVPEYQIRPEVLRMDPHIWIQHALLYQALILALNPMICRPYLKTIELRSALRDLMIGGSNMLY